MDGRLFLALAALLLVAGCTKDDPGAAYRSDPDAVRISAQVGDGLSGGFVTTRSNPVGNAGAETSFNTGDKVCVTADGQPAVVYAYDGISWTPQEGKFLKWNRPTMNFTAWYPAAEGVDFDNFTVPADQSDEGKIASADYMTFSAQVARGEGNNGVSLCLTRKMARIVVEPTIQNQFGEGYYISELKVHGNTKGYSGGNPAAGEVAVKAYEFNGKFYALFPPTTEAVNEVFIDVTVTKDGVGETLQAKGIPATEAGKSYTVSLKVGKNEASVTEVSVSPWKTSSDITEGEAVLVPYITFSAEGAQTFKMDFGSFALNENEGEYFEYSVNGGKWVQFTSTVSDVAFGGEKGNLRLRGKSSKGTATDFSNYSIISFGNTAKVSCTGDIRTLIDYKGYNTTASTGDARFCSLFEGCSQLTTAPELPSTSLAGYCYHNMFYNCTSLTKAPSKLPATTLPGYCYRGMFYGCTQLTTAPEICAKFMEGNSCCESMFSNCSSLTNVQEKLPATTLSVQCYWSMFEGCSSLTKAPSLPAETLATNCYSIMFWNCSNLSEAPELPAKTLAENCYNQMFGGCSKLSKVTMKATDVSANHCLYNWLTNNAGTSATSRTLTLASDEVYTAIESTLPDIWKKDASGTTIVYNNTSSSGE